MITPRRRSAADDKRQAGVAAARKLHVPVIDHPTDDPCALTRRGPILPPVRIAKDRPGADTSARGAQLARSFGCKPRRAITRRRHPLSACPMQVVEPHPSGSGGYITDNGPKPRAKVVPQYAEHLIGGGTMNKQHLVKGFAISTVSLLGLLLS